jgi:hypothetical protein
MTERGLRRDLDTRAARPPRIDLHKVSLHRDGSDFDAGSPIAAPRNPYEAPMPAGTVPSRIRTPLSSLSPPAASPSSAQAVAWLRVSAGQPLRHLTELANTMLDTAFLMLGVGWLAACVGYAARRGQR